MKLNNIKLVPTNTTKNRPTLQLGTTYSHQYNLR